MSAETKLLHLYKLIENFQKDNLKKKQSLIHSSFEVLSQLYLITKLESIGLLEENLSLRNKSEIITSFLPSTFSELINESVEAFYAECSELVKNPEFKSIHDPLGEIYQHVLSSTVKSNQGIVFTPLDIIKYIYSQIKFLRVLSETADEKTMDLACGSGLFLSEAVKRIIDKAISMNKPYEFVIEFIARNIYGFDIDPTAVLLTKVIIVKEIIDYYGLDISLDKPVILNIFETNSLELSTNKDSEQIQEVKQMKFDYIIGNPPYIDVKRMDKKTKNICKSNFPNVAKGKFDIYACFMELSSRMLTEDGQVGYIIPNKFLSSQYARTLRKRFLDENLIYQIVDLAHKKVFQPAVYPIILILRNKVDMQNKIQLITEVEVDDLISNKLDEQTYQVNSEIFKRTDNRTIFFPKEEYIHLLEKIFNQSQHSMGEIIRFRWSISFHRKGLRSQFIYPEKRGKNPKKILGGKEYGGNREVERYGTNWRGYWIDYDREKARELNNNFPKLEIFQKKKIIICQHALRMRATIDTEEYICKDIFLLGHLLENVSDKNISLEFILALINSKLYSFIYDIMYSGTEIMGKYLHYLPMFLHDLPFLNTSTNLKSEIEEFVTKMLSKLTSSERTKIDQKIDEAVFNAFNLTEREKSLISAYIDEHLIK